MTIYDWKQLSRDEQAEYPWTVIDWVQGEALGFFKHRHQAESMLANCQKYAHAFDATGRSRYGIRYAEEDEQLPPE